MNHEQRAASAWSFVKKELLAVLPESTERIPPGASPATIQIVERELGVTLPDSTLAVFLIHDGIGMPAVVDGLCRPSYLLSLTDALDFWRELTDLLNAESRVTDVAGPVRPVWWSARWLPITHDGAGNHHCVDLDPAEGGLIGQVVGFWHADGDRAVEAPDLATFLRDNIEMLRVWTDSE